MSVLEYTFDANTGIASVELNRPDVLNALDREMAELFREAVSDMARQNGLRCVVLTGAGRAFMAGGDVSGFADEKVRREELFNALLDAMNPAIVALRNLNAPILTGVHGVVAGAGLSLALMSDVVLSAPNTRFLIAYDRIGAVPDCGASWFLPRKVGMGRAARLMMLSESLTTSQALAWGIVSEISKGDHFDASLNAMARKLAAGPGHSYGAFRRLTDQSFGGDLAAHLETERAAFLDVSLTDDFAEGVAAFLGKRAANFTGC